MSYRRCQPQDTPVPLRWYLLMQPQIPTLNREAPINIDDVISFRILSFQNVEIIWLEKITSQRFEVLVSDTLVTDQWLKVQKVKFSE